MRDSNERDLNIHLCAAVYGREVEVGEHLAVRLQADRRAHALKAGLPVETGDSNRAEANVPVFAWRLRGRDLDRRDLLFSEHDCSSREFGRDLRPYARDGCGKAVVVGHLFPRRFAAGIPDMNAAAMWALLHAIGAVEAAA